ncbi:hypothetical protein PMAYCL1PPCAC_14603, partial [Pristionchus mayeri]
TAEGAAKQDGWREAEEEIASHHLMAATLYRPLPNKITKSMTDKVAMHPHRARASDLLLISVALVSGRLLHDALDALDADRI